MSERKTEHRGSEGMSAASGSEWRKRFLGHEIGGAKTGGIYSFREKGECWVWKRPVGGVDSGTGGVAQRAYSLGL